MPEVPGSIGRTSWRACAALGMVALCLRAPRMVSRWDEITLAYAAYAEPAAARLGAGAGVDALTGWMGLHPPLWPLLHGMLEHLWPAPSAWMGLSVLASAAAAALVTRVGGPLAGLLMAVAPLQLAYAAEVHNYPLGVAFVALVLAVARGPWWALALAAVGAGWTHLLSGGIACGVVVERAARTRDRDAARLLGAVLLGLLPIAAGAVGKMGQDSTFSQPTLDVGAWLDLVWENTGWLGLALGVAGLLGLRRVTLGALLGGLAVFGAALFSGAAAGHQRPYFILLAPILLLSAGQWGQRRGRWASLALALLALARLPGVVQEEGQRLQAIAADAQAVRAIDHALSHAEPGDTLWLVAPALQADDDKTATSPVLARLSPWTPMPAARPVAFEYADWRYGQPRHYQGLVVHTSTELYEGPFDHVAGAVLSRSGRVWVVLYEHGPAAGLMERVERVLRPYARTATRFPVASGLGDDHLWLLTGIEGAAP